MNNETGNVIDWLNDIVTNPMEWQIFYSASEQEFLAAYALSMLELRNAEWVKMTGMMPPEYVGHYECSRCGWHGSHHDYTPEIRLKFCPNCGSVMTNADNDNK